MNHKMSSEQQVSAPAITRHGSVTVSGDEQIKVSEFSFDGGTMKTTFTLSVKWAIEILQQEIKRLNSYSNGRPVQAKDCAHLPLGNIKGYDARN